MGEIAEDYHTGHCCTACMTYLKKAHGFPVLCCECWDTLTPSERDAYWPGTQRATIKEV